MLDYEVPAIFGFPKIVVLKLKDGVPQELWIAFKNFGEYRDHKEELDDLTEESDGIDRVCIFLRDTKQYRKLPDRQNVHISPETLEGFRTVYGKDNVTVRAVPKSVENRRRMN